MKREKILKLSFTFCMMHTKNRLGNPKIHKVEKNR